MTDPTTPEAATPIVTTELATSAEVAFSEACHQEIIKQAERLDDLAKELLKLELIIPGIYTAVIKLTANGEFLSLDTFTGLAFILWIIAIALTLFGLFPKRYDVQCEALGRVSATQSPTFPSTPREFFEKRAQHKRISLVLAVFTFFAGVVCAALAAFF
uniref:Uncharacterized protein n=1 Tax=Candidatus Kentrum sp. LFY TaxID=2126342 RepID=A0A450UHL1_9GAMM|nr:MAG: hypothetical protein BECKLFY1418A_GA0070994_102010 [Candidatus Kentron sp. LFY]